MKSVLLALLLSVVGCFGQAFTFSDPAFMCQTPPPVTSATPFAGYPTNQTGAYLWCAPGGWNASTLVWTNWSKQLTNSDAIDLTNTVSSTAPTLQAAALNGWNTLYFDGGDFLKSVNYTSTQPHTVWLVMSETNTAGIHYFDSVNSSYRNVLYANGTSKDAYAGSTMTKPTMITNKFFILRAVFNGASSGLWTNGVQVGTSGDAGSQNASGFTLASRYNRTAQRQMVVAEIITYQAALDAPTASNINAYLNWKYAITNQ